MFFCDVMQILSNFQDKKMMFFGPFTCDKMMQFSPNSVAEMLLDDSTPRDEVLNEVGLRSRILRKMWNRGRKDQISLDDVNESLLLDRVDRCVFAIYREHHYFVVVADIVVDPSVCVTFWVFDGLIKEVPRYLMNRLNLTMKVWMKYGLNIESEDNYELSWPQNADPADNPFGPRQEDGVNCGPIAVFNILRVGWLKNFVHWDATEGSKMRNHILFFLSRVGGALTSFGNKIFGPVDGDGDTNMVDVVSAHIKAEPGTENEALSNSCVEIVESDSEIQSTVADGESDVANASGVVSFCRFRLAAECRGSLQENMIASLRHIEFYWLKLSELECHRCVFFITDAFLQWWISHDLTEKKNHFRDGLSLLTGSFVPGDVPHENPIFVAAQHILIQMLRLAHQSGRENNPCGYSTFVAEMPEVDVPFCDEFVFQSFMLAPISGMHLPHNCKCLIGKLAGKNYLKEHLSVEESSQPLSSVVSSVVAFLSEIRDVSKRIVRNVGEDDESVLVRHDELCFDFLCFVSIRTIENCLGCN